MKKRIILFGTGYQGEKAYNAMCDKYEIVCFVDNDPKLVGQKMHYREIIGCDQIKKYWDNETDILICSSLYYYEMGNQLNDLGITRYYVFYDDDIYEGRVGGKEAPVRICTRCVMDNTSDKYILFKENGECNYCTSALKRFSKEYYPNKEGQRRLDDLLRRIKEDGKGKEYDCVVGISGGLDSSYLLYKGYMWGLRILAIHSDDGFDTGITKKNLEKLVSATGFDYEVIKPDPEQYNDLVLSYMRAGVPNIAIPQDNTLIAFIYKRMIEKGIKYFLSGGNFALECILQRGNSHNNLDIINMLDIHKKFGKRGIDKLEFLSEKQLKDYKNKYGIESPRPLDYIDYNRDVALKELYEFCGFEYYGGKHLENTFTSFVQMYWFFNKFGVDKRKSHLSSMIVSGQMDRNTALEELKKPLYDETTMNHYMSIIKEKYNIGDKEFEDLINRPPVEHEYYEVQD